MDDIIFGFVNATLWKEFAKSMQTEFEMSMMGELKFFMVIQNNQNWEGTYIHQRKYTKELLKKFDMLDCKQVKNPMHHTCILEKDDVSNKVE